MELVDQYWGMTSHKKLVIHLAKRQLPEFVFDAINLEGINMTLPEIQPLIDGITVGGHKVTDNSSSKQGVLSDQI